MKDIVIIKNDGRESRIVTGGFADSLKRLLDDDSRTIVVTDANVHRIYKEFIDQYDPIIIGQGESNKTLVTLEAVYRGLLERNADRSTFILGFGGGVVTDVTGFAASTYMRGLRFGFVPTTLLGQVDAAIGGKNGVNLDGYKNIAGTFCQPGFVVCDPAILSTLPEREFRSGLAEVIKAGIIGDRELFELIERYTFEDIRADYNLLANIIERSIRVKTDLVEADERETGLRRKLNLGHTFGHAFEKGSHNVKHGEAVAAGMVLISRAAKYQGLLSKSDSDRILETIRKTGLPTELPMEAKKLITLMKHDKKQIGDSVYMVLPREIGDCIVKPMTIDEIERILSMIDSKMIV